MYLLNNMPGFVTVCGRRIQITKGLVHLGRVDGENYCFLDDPQSVLEALKSCGTRVDIFTFHQKLPETEPRYLYPMEWDNFAALRITTFEEWWLKQIGFKARNKAKQAAKHGIEVREVPFDESLIRGIWEIYNETPIRQGKKFRHYGMSMSQIWRYAGTFLDRSIFIGAFNGERMIGFAKLTIDETHTQAGLMHIVSLVSERDKAPTNALIAHSVRACSDRGISYLVYANFAYGNKQSDSLSDFKERNGFQRINVPRYYIPLTTVGRVALRCGFHRRLNDRIPEPVAAKLRDLRRAWYSYRFSTSTES